MYMPTNAKNLRTNTCSRMQSSSADYGLRVCERCYQISSAYSGAIEARLVGYGEGVSERPHGTRNWGRSWSQRITPKLLKRFVPYSNNSIFVRTRPIDTPFICRMYAVYFRMNGTEAYGII